MCASMRTRYVAMLSIILGVLSSRGRLGAFGRARPSAARTTRFLWVLACGACRWCVEAFSCGSIRGVTSRSLAVVLGSMSCGLRVLWYS